MPETKKITKSEFKKEWANPKGGTIFYHDVWLEGDDKPWNIGAKDKSPAFLQAGNSLLFEVADASKRSIKRVQPPQQFGGSHGGSTFSQVGVTVGNAITNAVTLVANGKVDIKDLKATAHRIAEIAFELKEEFEGKA